MSTLAASDNGLLGDLSTKKLDNCKRWTGWQFIVISWGVGRVSSTAAMTRGSRGWNPLQGDSDKRQGRSILYIHRVALLPLNLRTVYEQSEETSKCAYLCFYLVGRSNSRDKKVIQTGLCVGFKSRQKRTKSSSDVAHKHKPKAQHVHEESDRGI